jgi:hypothetical protein
MPSPRGTNHARRFVVDRSLRGAAYDEAPSEAALNVYEFCRGKLSEEDHLELAKLLGIDPHMSMDNEEGGPVPFRGMPERGGGQAQDGRRAIAGLTGKTLAHVMSIKVSP